MSTPSLTALARLEAEGRLFNSVFKGPTRKPGRIGFRGDIALKFQTQLADEKRPPEISAEQIIATVDGESGRLSFLTGFLLSFEYLQLLVDAIGDQLSPDGKYFLFCDNVDLARRYQVELGGASFHILPIDEATVYNEILALLGLEKTELKRLDGAAKIDAIADAAAAFKDTFAPQTFAEGVALMGPVRNPYENRPV